MPWSSNATLLVTVRCGEEEMRAIYKPEEGERPLWDYPSGLWRREVATYVVSEILGWGLVPETIGRHDAPMGRGSLQRFVEDADFEQHYFTLIDEPAYHDRLRQMCVFDLVINNADRKGGHCLVTSDGEIFGIDHGLPLWVYFISAFFMLVSVGVAIVVDRQAASAGKPIAG